MTFYQTWITAAILFSSITISADSAIAQKNYDVGASDTEIKLGQTMPYSGQDPSDPQWRDDPAVKEYLAWAKRWYPEGDPEIWDNVLGYSSAQLMVEVLRRCGDELTRENLLRQATDIKDLQLPMMLPGIKINTGPKDYLPVKQVQLVRFDGERWVRFGEIVSSPWEKR